MTLDLEDLQRKAEAATPGPWDHETKKFSEAIYTPHRSGPSISISWGAGSRNSPIWGTPERAKADAAFIAAANPEAVLALIAELKQMRGEVQSLRESRDNLDRCLREKDAAMNVLFQRLDENNISVEDLIP